MRADHIVDDDPGQRNLLRSFLQGQGLTVTVAASAREALDHCCVQTRHAHLRRTHAGYDEMNCWNR